MIYCISGTHRNGKTTTATAVAEMLRCKAIETNISAMPMWRKIGSPSSAVSFAERLYVQKEIFQYIRNIIEAKSPRPEYTYIMDRSPMDLIGYLLANIDDTCSSIFDEDVHNLISDIQTFTRDNIQKSYFLSINHNIGFCPEVGKNNKIYNTYAYRRAISNNILASYAEYIEDENFQIIMPDITVEMAEKIVTDIRENT